MTALQAEHPVDPVLDEEPRHHLGHLDRTVLRHGRLPVE